MKKKLAIVLSCTLAAILLFGCTSKEPTTTEGETQQKETTTETTPAVEKETEENLCAAAVVFPDLQDRKLWESYGAKSSAEVLQKMLTPAEYLRLQKAVMVLNGFQKRKAERRETAKN